MSSEGELPKDPIRSRIIDATFQVLMEHGYAGASTREIHCIQCGNVEMG